MFFALKTQMSKELIQAQIDAIKVAAKELRHQRQTGDTSGTADVKQVIDSAVAFLEGLKDSELFAKKRPGSAATYKQSFEIIKEQMPVYEEAPITTLAQLRFLLEDLKDEPSGGRRKTRRRRFSRRRTSKK